MFTSNLRRRRADNVHRPERRSRGYVWWAYAGLSLAEARSGIIVRNSWRRIRRSGSLADHIMMVSCVTAVRDTPRLASILVTVAVGSWTSSARVACLTTPITPMPCPRMATSVRKVTSPVPTSRRIHCVAGRTVPASSEPPLLLAPAVPCGLEVASPPAPVCSAVVASAPPPPPRTLALRALTLQPVQRVLNSLARPLALAVDEQHALKPLVCLGVHKLAAHAGEDAQRRVSVLQRRVALASLQAGTEDVHRRAEDNGERARAVLPRDRQEVLALPAVSWNTTRAQLLGRAIPSRRKGRSGAPLTSGQNSPGPR